ncbi:MAG: OPT/YSL family transporter [Phycisphaeraceae bacterium]|nr:OPT/YSL family transporter [Phycisphaeraceae bacterium]
MTTPSPEGLPAHIEPPFGTDQKPAAIDVANLTDLMAGMTPEQKDLYWYKNVYQGDRMPQLTWRAVLMGGFLGMLMAASNLYTTLAIGWAFGVAITACVMSYVIWNGMRFVSANKLSQMSMLENNCMQSTASAAGYSTGSTIATMFGAMLLLSDPGPGKTNADVATWSVMNPWVVVLFTLCTGLMGVFLAVPLKRQMINHEQLRFPSGVAAAETLRNLYSESKDAIARAYVLIAGIAAGIVVGILNTDEDTANKVPILGRFFNFMRTHLFEVQIPGAVPEAGFFQIAGKQLQAFSYEPNLLYIGAGIITRMRVCLSMFAGSLLLYLVVGPWLISKDMAMPGSGWSMVNGQEVFSAASATPGVIRNIDLNGSGTVFRLTTWSLWGGTAVMVFASLTALALQWKTVLRAVTGIGADRSTGGEHTDALKKVEVPLSWMIAGMIPITIAMLAVQIMAFHISWWAGLIAIGMSFFLSLVACRATGETDTTPIGAMGKVMQLLFAGLHPGQIFPNLAAAGIAANSASSSADLLTDLKSGYLLGANARRQFIAQFFGVFFGTLAIVPVWFLMVPNRAELEKFAAPATRQWEAVARVLTKGIDQLPVSAQYAILIGAAVGILLPVIERLLPTKYKTYVPSAMGLGLSWVIPFASALGFFLGAIIGKIWELIHKSSAERFSVATACGIIAGESLIKALIAMTATALFLLNSSSSAPAPSAAPTAAVQPAGPASAPPAPLPK